MCEALYAQVLDSHAAGAFPIVIGGDHSLAAGSVAASATHAKRQGRPLGLIWVDAHADMNTPATTMSGNVHGMPLAALLGEDPRELALVGGYEPKVAPGHTVLVGIRNLDEREKEEVRASGVHVFTMKDIDRQGAASVIEQAIEIAGRDTAGIHVSFDLDVCDPAIAPGVGTPVRGGLNYREAHMAMETPRRRQANHRARSGGGEPGSGPPEHDRGAGRRTGRERARPKDSLTMGLGPSAWSVALASGIRHQASIVA